MRISDRQLRTQPYSERLGERQIDRRKTDSDRHRLTHRQATSTETYRQEDYEQRETEDIDVSKETKTSKHTSKETVCLPACLSV
jgi:hypothetical protein